MVGLAALAAWQLHRRAWKLDLIARVEARVHAAPTPAPSPGSWADISATADERDPASWQPSPGHVSVTGLLRMPEPGGAFLRSNDPAADRWFSRDVAAISASRGLGTIAPYFIDAEREPGGSRPPIGGLTVIAFSNNHVLYALTWGTLALMAAAGAVFVNLDLLRSRSELREW